MLAGRRGTTVARLVRMIRELLPAPLTMTCPRCGRGDVEADADGSLVIAWFTCPACGYDWSARLRNGRPDAAISISVPALVPRPAG